MRAGTPAFCDAPGLLPRSQRTRIVKGLGTRRFPMLNNTKLATARFAAGACLLAASLALPGTAAVGATSASGAGEAHAAAQRLVANLRGGEEQDPDGTGHAVFRLF